LGCLAAWAGGVNALGLLAGAKIRAWMEKRPCEAEAADKSSRL
jgi:hypothetical protein